MTTNDDVPRGVQTTGQIVYHPEEPRFELIGVCRDCEYVLKVNYDRFESISEGFENIFKHAQSRKHKVIVHAIKDFYYNYEVYTLDYKSNSFMGKIENWFYKHKKIINIFGAFCWLFALYRIILVDSGWENPFFWINIFTVFCWSVHLGMTIFLEWDKIVNFFKKLVRK